MHAARCCACRYSTRLGLTDLDELTIDIEPIWMNTLHDFESESTRNRQIREETPWDN